VSVSVSKLPWPWLPPWAWLSVLLMQRLSLSLWPSPSRYLLV
jgi:hypothetical protein